MAKVTTPIQVDISGWTGSMLKLAAWRYATLHSNMSMMNELMVEVVTAWPFDGDPQDVESYNNLKWEQWPAVVDAVHEAVVSFWNAVKAEKVDGLEIDINGWTQSMKKLTVWNEAALSFHVPRQSQLMTEVITAWPYDGDPQDIEAYAELTPVQYQTIAQEVGKAISRKFRRK